MAFWLLRWLSYLSIALLIGSAFFVASRWPAGRSDGRVLLLRRIAWWTALGSAVGSLLLQGTNVAGTSLVSAFDPALLGDTVGTMFGVLLMVRLGALVAMRFLPDRPVLVLAGCVLVGTRPSVSTAASSFSFVATVSVGVLAGSGVVMALRDVNLSAALGGSGYVRLLLCKLAAAAAMVGRGRDRDRRGGARVDRRAGLDLAGRHHASPDRRRRADRDVPEVTVTLSLPSGGVGSVPVPLVRTSAGQWRLDVTVRTTGFDESTVRADVRVRWFPSMCGCRSPRCWQDCAAAAACRRSSWLSRAGSASGRSARSSAVPHGGRNARRSGRSAER